MLKSTKMPFWPLGAALCGLTSCAMPGTGPGDIAQQLRLPSLDSEAPAAAGAPGMHRPDLPAAPVDVTGDETGDETVEESLEVSADPTFASPLDTDTQRRRRSPRDLNGFAMWSVGFGDYQFKDDFLGRDEVDGRLFRGQFGMVNEYDMGFGMDVTVLVPKDDYFEGTVDRTSSNEVDLYAYAFADPLTELTRGRFRLPMHVGPYLRFVNTEDEATGLETDYTSLGIRVEAMPEIVMSPPHAGFEASMFARFSAGAHVTDIDDEWTREYYDSTGYTLGLQIGGRLTFGRMALQMAYVRNTSTVRESDPERGVVVPRLETDFEGVEFSAGVSF